MSALAAILGVAVAVFALTESIGTSNDQKKLEGRVEERSVAPVLAAGVEPAMRGKKVVLHTIVGKVVKPAELARFAPSKRAPRHLLLVPVWNVGNGLAVWRRTRVLRDCQGAFDQAFDGRPGNVRRLGFYNVPVGLSEQIGDKIGKHQRGAAEIDAKRNKLFVYVLYTDLLNDRDRATCMTWKRGKARKPWRLSTQDYRDDNSKSSMGGH